MKQCSNCKQWKDESELCSPSLSLHYCTHFYISPSDAPENIKSGNISLCHRCLRTLSQRECKKRHQGKAKYRISHNLSTGIRKSLRTGKGGSWEKLTGYTLQELKEHLEEQFVDGMSWDNYGEWHIDHIRPVVSFNFTEPEDADFKACWALSNLRPLWAVDNWGRPKV